MVNFSGFDNFHSTIKSNRWYWYFSIFCRITLAFGFFAAGMVKILGERFASGLSEVHPMGAYLEALYHTGYYYTFIGIVQVLAAILLLIPRTVLLGALLYLPIIINIFILSYAVRFEGSYVTSPLMLLANIYLLVWHYDKLKYILPRSHNGLDNFKQSKKLSNKFPFLFFGGVLISIASIVFYAEFGHEIMPRYSYSDCILQFDTTVNKTAGIQFCECIHTKGIALDDCLKNYD